MADDARTGVLVVDDDELFRLLVRTILESKGFAVTSAANGDAAFEMLRHGTSPAVIVTDMTMPVADGLMLCRRLRESDDYCHIPVVLVTGDVGDRRVLEAGTLPGVTVQDKKGACSGLAALLDQLVTGSRLSEAG